MSTIRDITPSELKLRLDAGEHPKLLDVRESWERAIARLPDSVHIPLREVAARTGELEPDQELIIYCKSGLRSRRAAEFLATRGFSRLANLAGGIDGWREEVDPELPDY
jgi:adenylyltransferase/sulfurtransferase